jgi:hypothetical protein
MKRWTIALVLGTASVAAGCDRRATAADVATGTVLDSAEQVMYGARSALTDAGILRGDLVADTVLSLESATRFELRGVRARFVSTLGRPLGTLTAREGTFWPIRALLEARGTVAIASDTNRRRIEGAWVRYDAASNRLTSDSAFVAIGPGRRLTGVGFTADPGLVSVKCVTDCTGSLP